MTSTSMLTLLGFLAVCFAVASSGAVFRPTAWYDSLDKPSWTPPRWLFPVVWTVLYVLIAVAGWRVWTRVGFALLPFLLYAAQLGFNAAWSWLFFGLKRPDAAFADLVLMWCSIAGTTLVFAEIDGDAAILFLPYLAWVTAAGESQPLGLAPQPRQAGARLSRLAPPWRIVRATVDTKSYPTAAAVMWDAAPHDRQSAVRLLRHVAPAAAFDLARTGRTAPRNVASLK